MASKVTNDALAAMIRSLEKSSDERHSENVKRLDAIIAEAKLTNGRVADHEKRLSFLELIRGPGSSMSLDWKRVGGVAGGLAFFIWGAVDILWRLFGFADSIGARIIGK